MKVQIIAISDSDKHFSTAIKEYVKRMGKKLTITTIKPIKHGSLSQIIAKETHLILKKIEKTPGPIILLSKEGKQRTTEELKKEVESYSLRHATLTFVIGGPYGLDESLLQNHITARRSFGSHTMPHGLAQLVLLEQWYRIQTLIDGKKYHY